MKTRALTAAATNAVSPIFYSNGRPVTLVVTGTFGGATVVVQVEADSTGPTYAAESTSLTAAGARTFTIAKEANFRLLVSGGTGVSVDAWVHISP